MIAQLLEDPHRFGFFQAVRLLHRWFRREDGGADRSVLDRRLRFRNSLALDFPASEIETLRAVTNDASTDATTDATTHGTANAARDVATEAAAPDVHAAVQADTSTRAIDPASIHHVEITPTFMGLLGVTGALPTHYTEMLAHRETYHRDKAARAFLDIFQHRAVALFYEGWRKHRLPLHYEVDGRNRFLPHVLALAGLGQPSLRDRMLAGKSGVSDHAVAFYAGAIQQQTHSAQSVENVVSTYFGVVAKVRTFVGRWYPLPTTQHSLIGLGHATLGRDALLGERVWQRDLRVGLDIGPLDLELFNRFLPGGPASVALRELLHLLTGNSLEYEVRLHLKASEIRGSRLDEAPRGTWLGWNSFLISKLQREDRSDVCYDLFALA